MNLLGITGSLRAASYNSLILRDLHRLAPAGVDIKLFEDLREIPPYDENHEIAPPPPAVAALCQAIARADAIVFAMPEFNHSVPGVLKNAIDWTTHPLRSAVLTAKVCGVCVATQGRGGFRGMSDLSRILRDLGNFVVPAPEVCIQFVHTRVRIDAAGEVEYLDAIAPGLLRVLLNSMRAAVEARLGMHTGQSVQAALALGAALAAKAAG